MNGHEQYLPSSSERVRDQVARYEATDGREGGTLEGRPVVVLAMTGAVTGKIRKTPVMRIERDGVYVAVASAAGAPRHPAWYYNLIATARCACGTGRRCTGCAPGGLRPGEGGDLAAGRVALAAFSGVSRQGGTGDSHPAP